MHFDSSMPPTTLLALDGELIGCVIEADTTDGYVIQGIYEQRFRPAEPRDVAPGPTRLSDWRPSTDRPNGGQLASTVVDTGEKIYKKGRVDFIGDSAKDDQRVLYDRLNKIRTELGLPLYNLPPFLDD